MGQILVRNVDDAVLKGLKVQAKANGRSAEAEVREILAAAVPQTGKPRKPLASLIGKAVAGRSQSEIDAYIRALRDEWER